MRLHRNRGHDPDFNDTWHDRWDRWRRTTERDPWAPRSAGPVLVPGAVFEHVVPILPEVTEP